MTDRAIQNTESNEMDPRDSIGAQPTTMREHGMGLYKPGQGYWTRVGTAIGLLLLLLSGVAWIVKQCELVPIPISSWKLNVSGVQGNLASGDSATVFSDTVEGKQPTVIATAKVTNVETIAQGRKTVFLDQIAYTEGNSTVASGKVISFGNSTAAEALKVDSTTGIRVFELAWLQIASGASLFLLGAGLTYWFVGVRARSVDFLIATDAEMKKVNWSTRKTIIDSTWMVVGASVLIAALIYAIDIAFQWFFAFIKVLHR
jgi:preprotein translocase SecE subunit